MKGSQCAAPRMHNKLDLERCRMRNIWRETNAFLGRFLTPAVRLLLIVNVMVFILFVLLTPFSSRANALFLLLMQTPDWVIHRRFVWQVFTYMFLHADFVHLLFNMLILWFFGPRLEYRWGSSRFLTFYVVVGVGSGLFHLFLASATGKGATSLLGASGALYGLLMAWALFWPTDNVYLYGIFRIQIKYLVILVAVISFMGSTGGADKGGISHITHLGGLVVALIYLKGQDLLRRRRGGPRRGRVVQVDPSRHPDFR